MHEKLTNKAVHSNEDHDKCWQVQSKHLREFENFTSPITGLPLNCEKPGISNKEKMIRNINTNKYVKCLYMHLLLSITLSIKKITNASNKYSKIFALQFDDISEKKCSWKGS